MKLLKAYIYNMYILIHDVVSCIIKCIPFNFSTVRWSCYLHLRRGFHKWMYFGVLYLLIYVYI